MQVNLEWRGDSWVDYGHLVCSPFSSIENKRKYGGWENFAGGPHAKSEHLKVQHALTDVPDTATDWTFWGGGWIDDLLAYRSKVRENGQRLRIHRLRAHTTFSDRLERSSAAIGHICRNREFGRSRLVGRVERVRRDSQSISELHHQCLLLPQPRLRLLHRKHEDWSDCVRSMQEAQREV